jgi:hypothetical protein
MDRLIDLVSRTPRPLATLMLCLTAAVTCLAIAQILRMPRRWRTTLDAWPISIETNLFAFCLLIGWSSFALPAFELSALAVVIVLGEVVGRRASKSRTDVAPAAMILFMTTTAALGALAAPAAMTAALPAIKQATFMGSLPFEWASPLELGVGAVVSGLAAAELCISLLIVQVLISSVALCGWGERRRARFAAGLLLAEDHKQGALAPVDEQQDVRA